MDGSFLPRTMRAPASDSLYLKTGPFTTHLRTRLPQLLEALALLYDGHPLASHADFADFHVEVSLPVLRRWYHPKVQFSIDGVVPFLPLPLAQVLPMFEWGLNWCISQYANQFLILHAAALEKNGCAVIMPGRPGSGKSTLTAGLVNRGWRLLSDELTLIAINDGGHVVGLARPISLKNESIEVIRSFAPSAKMSPITRDTIKGDIALLKPPAESIARVAEPARPAWIIFPKFLNGLPAVLEPKPKAAIMIELANNAFNLSLYGAAGFNALADMVDGCHCYKFTYADLNEAVEIFDRLEPRGRATT